MKQLMVLYKFQLEISTQMKYQSLMMISGECFVDTANSAMKWIYLGSIVFSN